MKISDEGRYTLNADFERIDFDSLSGYDCGEQLEDMTDYFLISLAEIAVKSIIVKDHYYKNKGDNHDGI